MTPDTRRLPPMPAWTGAEGPTGEELYRAGWQPEPPLDEHEPRVLPSTWKPVDLTAILEGRYKQPEPTVGARADGAGLFYAGRTHTISSESEGGKTWLCLSACDTELRAGNHVLYIDFEDDEVGIVGRLLTSGTPTSAIQGRFHYVRPEEPLGAGRWEIAALIGDTRPTLAILDGVTEGMVLHGLNPLDNADCARFGRLLPGAIAKQGPAVVSSDHVTKSTEGRGRYSIGAVHKLNGLNGAAYMLENRNSFGVGLLGKSTVLVAKDRPGQVRKHALPTKQVGLHYFADLVVDSSIDDYSDISLIAPAVFKPDPGGFRPTVIMAKISDLLSEKSGLSKNAIETMIGGKAAIVRTALELLINEGYVAQEKDGRGFKHVLVKAFGDDE